MSRYLLLVLLNLPLILLGILSAISRYKLNHIGKKRLAAQLLLWVFVFFGLTAANTIYTWLFSRNLTNTESLSLFDVIEITAIIFLYYIVSRNRAKLEALERRFRDLHTEISIITSVTDKNSK